MRLGYPACGGIDGGMPRHVMVSPEEDLAEFYNDASVLRSPAEAAGAVSTDAAPAATNAGDVATESVLASENVSTVATDVVHAVEAAPAPVVAPPAAAPAPKPDALPGLTARRTVVPSPVPPEFATNEEMPPQLARVTRPMPDLTEAPPAVVGAPHPALALGMSLILPGVGQMYAGQILKGSVILGISVFTCMGGGLFNLLAAADAFLIAKRVGRGETLTDWTSF